jgi:phosphatidate phosphatase APP1
VPFRARLDEEGSREFEGTLRLLGPEGVSVISDVDDTVKDSNVLDRGELVANTFLRPYRAVTGMPDLYGAWGARGVAVHYVTASPWQLFPPIWSFLNESGFPGVQIEMREVRVADASVVDLFRDSRAYKAGRIREILRRFPGRSFALVGDSGERDPEVYAAIAREFPGSVRGIFIRAVGASHLDRSRYREVFAGIEESRWIVFSDPAELPRDLGEWIRSPNRPSGGD